MQPSIAQSYSESEMFSSDTFSSQDSFKPNSQSHCRLASTQDGAFSSKGSEQFSSFKPKRDLSKMETAQRNPKKKVRFADDQNAPSFHQEENGSGDEFEGITQFDLNVTCPIDLGNLDASFDASPTPSQLKTPLIRTCNTPDTNTATTRANGKLPARNTPIPGSYNNLILNRSNSSEGKDSNPNYTYVMRETIVKNQDNIVSYTVRKSYQDNQLNSSIQQSLHLSDDVTPGVVLEQREQVQDMHNGDVRYAQRLAFKGLGAQSENVRVSENFARKNEMNSNRFFSEAPMYSHPTRSDYTFQFPHQGNQMQSQEFDTPGYQSSQHSEFGNPFPDSSTSEYLPSSQHSFLQDDEFVPNEFTESRINSFDFENMNSESISPDSVADQSNRSFSSQNRNFEDPMDSAVSPASSLEFTPIISKLQRQLSLESDTSHRAKLSDIHYL